MVHHIERGFGQQGSDNNEPITDQFMIPPVARHIDHDTQQTASFQVPVQHRHDYQQQQPHQAAEISKSKSLHEKRNKMAIKVGAGLMAVAVASGLSLGIVKANSEKEAQSPSSTSAEQNPGIANADYLEYAMDQESDAEFFKRPLVERLSYGQEHYNRSAEMYFNKINSAVTRDNEVNGQGLHVMEGVTPPVLSRDSTAQEIMDFHSVVNALRTGGDKGAKVGSLYIDDNNSVDSERLNESDASKPNTISINTYSIFSDSGYYEKNGSTYIDITHTNPLYGNEPVENTYKQEVFTSTLDGKEYVTYRIMSSEEEF